MNDLSILGNVKIALANNGSSLSSLDAGAVATLCRLSVLLDAKFDTGDTADLAQLLARHANLMDALLLTPKSRNAGSSPVVQETDHGKEFSETYLRLIKSPVAVKPRKRSVPRATGGAASGKRGDAVDGVAETRNGPSPSSRPGRKVD